MAAFDSGSYWSSSMFGTAPLHVHLCARMCAEPHTDVQRLPCIYTCAFTHTCMHTIAQPYVRTPSMGKQKCITKRPCAKTLMHTPVFMDTHTCVHPIPLHNHVHKDTSAAPALHTAMCTHTHAKLSPASTVHTATRNACSEVQHHLCTPPYARIPALTARGQNAARVAQPTRRRWAMSGGKAPCYAHSFSSLE